MILRANPIVSADWQGLDAVPPETTGALRTRYQSADPFPYLVIDGLFDPAALHAIGADFAMLPDLDRQVSHHRLQTKAGTRPDATLPPATQAYFDLVGSGPFVRLLERLTGIAHLLPDPSLHGGGMHEVPTDGRFELHVDFQRHPATGLDNRLVVITYLNEDWPPEHGGALELWRAAPRRRAEAIHPVFGRTLLMSVGRDHLHGLIDPVRAPDRRPRRSIAAYYYTSPAATAVPGRSVTRYYHRPGSGMRDLAIHAALNLLPPAATAGARRVLGARRVSGRARRDGSRAASPR